MQVSFTTIFYTLQGAPRLLAIAIHRSKDRRCATLNMPVPQCVLGFHSEIAPGENRIQSVFRYEPPELAPSQNCENLAPFSNSLASLHHVTRTSWLTVGYRTISHCFKTKVTGLPPSHLQEESYRTIRGPSLRILNLKTQPQTSRNWGTKLSEKKNLSGRFRGLQIGDTSGPYMYIFF